MQNFNTLQTLVVEISAFAYLLTTDILRGPTLINFLWALYCNNGCRNHSGYGLIEWETTLLCNVVSLAEPIPRMIPVQGGSNCSAPYKAFMLIVWTPMIETMAWIRNYINCIVWKLGYGSMSCALLIKCPTIKETLLHKISNRNNIGCILKMAIPITVTS